MSVTGAGSWLPARASSGGLGAFLILTSVFSLERSMQGAAVDRSPSAGLRASFRSGRQPRLPFLRRKLCAGGPARISRHPLKCRALPGMADFLRRQPLFWSGILDSGRTAAPYPPASLSGEESEVGAPRSVVLPS